MAIIRGTYYTGTSNIVVPGNKTTFPEAYRSGTRLHYYSSLFNSLEINSSFYKIPMAATFEKWAADTPSAFRFTIKLWRGITHAKELAYTDTDIDRFMLAANRLGDKKGCLLIQFPASISNAYYKNLEQILQRIQKNEASSPWRKAVEFRHKSWYTPDTFSLLDRYQSSLVLHDMPVSAISEPSTNAAFILLRFHGQDGDYKGSYPAAFLQTKASQINTWLSSGKDVYAYFNNTIGDAYHNALLLREMVG